MTAAADLATLLERLSDRSDLQRFGSLAEPVEPHDATATLETGPTPIRVLGPVRSPHSTSERFVLVRVLGEDRPRWISARRLEGDACAERWEPEATACTRTCSAGCSCVDCDDERGALGGE